MTIRTNLVGTIVVAAALLVPLAQADDWATDGITASGIAGSTHPDNRAEPRGPGAIAAQQGASKPIRPDDRPEPRGPGAFTTTQIVESSGGFDWSSAAIGMVGGIGAALLLTGGLFVFLGQRSRTTTA